LNFIANSKHIENYPLKSFGADLDAFISGILGRFLFFKGWNILNIPIKERWRERVINLASLFLKEYK